MIHMLQAERRKYIIQHVKKNGKVVVEEIAQELNISPMTIRRDLKYLEDKQLIKRTHGGAVPHDTLVKEIPYQQKTLKNMEEKKRIADYASTFIEEGYTVILDAGTTNMEIAKKITEMNNIKVITTDLIIGAFLSQFPKITVYCTGGMVQNVTRSCTGGEAKAFLEKVCADVAFIGASSIDVDKGVTCPTFEKAQLKRQMMLSAEQAILVTDHEKFGMKSMAKICSLNDLDLIITDECVDKGILEKILDDGIDVKVV